MNVPETTDNWRLTKKERELGRRYVRQLRAQLVAVDHVIVTRDELAGMRGVR